jgi:hypothetical protein
MKAFLSVAGLLLVACAALAQTQASPAQTESSTAELPQDKHDGVTISVDAYTRIERGKEKFGKANPLAVGILPVEVFFKNDTALPVKLTMSTIQLEVRTNGGANHQDLDWLAPVQVASAVAHPNGPSQPTLRRFPIGVGLPKDEKRDKMLEMIRPFAFDSDILPPQATIHGFFFFDVSGQIPAPGDASLYVPDLTEATSNKPLMFFEVALANGPAQ